MNLTSLMMVTMSTLGQAPSPVPMAQAPAAVESLAVTPTGTLTGQPLPNACAVPLAAPARKRFESDHEFDGFVNPISNPIFAKDPRANTWARLLFINNNFPSSHPFGGGNAQAYAMQLNLALTDRLAIIVDKDGYAHIAPKNGAATNGWLNIAAGLKYTLIRDVENQFLFAAGLMYEAPSGARQVFQDNGSGAFTPFITYGKEFCQHWHFLGTHGYSIAVDQTQNSSFFYHSLHLDREINGWFYPLVELNWFQYTQGGNLLPRVIGEGDGLLNLGTQGMAGRQMLSTAVGAKFKLGDHAYAGAAYEIALSDYKGILNNRITVDFVLRY